jgi:hypothetical protein
MAAIRIIASRKKRRARQRVDCATAIGAAIVDGQDPGSIEKNPQEAREKGIGVRAERSVGFFSRM